MSLECHQTCALCTGPEPTQCTQCVKGLALDPNTMMCGVTGDSDCPPRTFLHANQFICQACYRHCQSCEGPEPTDCQTCALPRYLHSKSACTSFSVWNWIWGPFEENIGAKVFLIVLHIYKLYYEFMTIKLP